MRSTPFVTHIITHSNGDIMRLHSTRPHLHRRSFSPPQSLSAAGLSSLTATAGVPTLGTGVSYAPPALTSVSMTGADSPSSGGAPFSIRGSGFGPAPGTSSSAAATTAFVDFCVYGHSSTALAAAASAALRAIAQSGSPSAAASSVPGVYVASGCNVLSDGLLSCSTGPGIGRNLSVRTTNRGRRARCMDRIFAPAVLCCAFSSPHASYLCFALVSSPLRRSYCRSGGRRRASSHSTEARRAR